MLRRLSEREILEGLFAEFQPQIRDAWMEAIQTIRSRVTLRALIERLERGDIAGAIESLGIEDGVFARFEQSILQAYHNGGIATVGRMPVLRDPTGSQVHFSWGVRNLPAEQAMRQHAANLVIGTTAEMKQGIREVLTENLSRGQSPYDAGRMIAGHVNRATGQREGGLVGLTPGQMKTVSWIDRDLHAGDPEAMRQYLGLKLRDKRLDRSIVKALQEGKGMSAEDAGRAARLYSNRALKYRADGIARHETMVSLGKARHDAFRQQIDDGKLLAEDVTKTWKHQTQEHPRMQHVAMEGQVVAFDQPFLAPDGTPLRYPHDPDAPASHTIGCKCRVEYRIDFTAQAIRKHRGQTGG